MASLSLSELTNEIILANMRVGENIDTNDLIEQIITVHKVLAELEEQEEALTGQHWKEGNGRSIHSIICRVCGKSYKQITLAHLQGHGLSIRTYRARFGIHRTQRLTSERSHARRRAAVAENRFWETCPKYLISQSKPRPHPE